MVPTAIYSLSHCFLHCSNHHDEKNIIKAKFDKASKQRPHVTMSYHTPVAAKGDKYKALFKPNLEEI